MSEKCQIRAAVREDASDLMQLMKEFAANLDKADDLKLTEEGLISSVFDKGYGKVLIVTVDGYAVGFALYYMTFTSFAGKPTIYLEDFYITPMFRGRGYGSELMKVLIKMGSKEGCMRMEWKCLKWNTKAIDFYERLGATREEDNITFMLSTNEVLEGGIEALTSI